jgi:acyl-CoA hydrolase
VVLLQVSPADEDGYHSLGCAVDYVWDAAQVARVVLVEVNSNMPHTRCVYRLHCSRVVVSRHSAAPLFEVPHEAPNAVQLQVAKQVAGLVPNGAAIQLGIGGLAAAVAGALAQHRGLKVRSGMAGDWLLDLIACGAIDTAHPEACLASLAVGSHRLYQALGANGPLELVSVARLVSPLFASPLGGVALPFIAINSAIEVDLYGQVNAELLGERYVGAMGGQADYFRAARRSPGGLAIVALPATTGPNGKSRIVRRIASAYVTSAQSDIDFMVTEHGAADLRATTLSERRLLIAQLAGPRFRDALLEGQANDLA